MQATFPFWNDTFSWSHNDLNFTTTFNSDQTDQVHQSWSDAFIPIFSNWSNCMVVKRHNWSGQWAWWQIRNSAVPDHAKRLTVALVEWNDRMPGWSRLRRPALSGTLKPYSIRPPLTPFFFILHNHLTAKHSHILYQTSIFSNPIFKLHPSKWLDAAKVARASERVVPSDTERFYETTSRVSLSPLSDVLLAEVVSSVFPLWSTKRVSLTFIVLPDHH